MNVPPLQPRPVPPRPHWTEPVSREETLARREKFRKIGWLPPNGNILTFYLYLISMKLLWMKLKHWGWGIIALCCNCDDHLVFDNAIRLT